MIHNFTTSNIYYSILAWITRFLIGLFIALIFAILFYSTATLRLNYINEVALTNNHKVIQTKGGD